MSLSSSNSFTRVGAISPNKQLMDSYNATKVTPELSQRATNAPRAQPLATLHARSARRQHQPQPTSLFSSPPRCSAQYLTTSRPHHLIPSPPHPLTTSPPSGHGAAVELRDLDKTAAAGRRGQPGTGRLQPQVRHNRQSDGLAYKILCALFAALTRKVWQPDAQGRRSDDHFG